MAARIGVATLAARLAPALLIWPTLAVAETASEGPRPGPYFAAGGGFVHLERSLKEGGGLRFRQSHDAGGAAYGAAGYSFGRFRLESEISYRGNDGDGLRGARDLRRGAIDSYGFMANGLFEPFPDWALSPYLGAGLGGAVLVTEGARFTRGGEDVRVTERSDAELAYQAIAGARMSFGPTWSVRADYRYFATLDPEFGYRAVSAGGAERGRIEGEYKSHALMVGLSYHFGRDAPSRPEDARERLARDLAIRG
ncbi:MAG: porin family protein, partial [Alphaproteobacteria bacterium]|nr:porin family protein [Alphaproteobacteria bacterium]